MRKTYAVLGGDGRQLRLADLLRQDGRRVQLWGFEQPEGWEISALEEAAAADVVILPLPLSRDGNTLHLPLWTGQLALEALWPLLDSRQCICGGSISPSVLAQAAGKGLEVIDYYGREEVQIGNAVPTAEGAIQAAMEATACTLHSAQTLVIGYGRIGKVLAQDLQGLGADVAVSARRSEDLAWVKARGYNPLHTESLSGELGGFDVIFNTVPSMVLSRALLEEVKRGCVVIDVASEPGGVDFAAADELGVRVFWARALPGKVAPETAAKVIRDAIYHILEERGEPI